MGLFDGKSGGGELASTAHVAKLLDAPVVLVVDARAMARSVGRHGPRLRDLRPRAEVAGVVLNRVGSNAHEKMLRDALKPLGVPVLGVLRRDDAHTDARTGTSASSPSPSAAPKLDVRSTLWEP